MSVDDALFKLQNLQDSYDWKLILWQWIKEGRIVYREFKDIITEMVLWEERKQNEGNV